MANRFFLLVAIMLVAAVPVLAQEEAEPTWTATPHYLNPPSLPVKGPIVHRVPGQPGPTPGMEGSEQHLIGIMIAGYPFMMKPGPCAFKVEAAIQAHADLFSADEACDGQIRKARTIQREKEAENPAYAHGVRITPAPTSGQSGEMGSKR